MAMMAYVEMVKETLQGPPPEKVGEATGIPWQSISAAQNHASIADEFPFMQAWPQYRVLEAKEYIEKLPEEEYPEISRLLR